MNSRKIFDIRTLAHRILLGVEMFGHPEVSGVDTITFNFDGQYISVSATADDTLVWSAGSVFPLYEDQIRKASTFWDDYIGIGVAFVWNMKNQSDCQDAAQFMFAPTESGLGIVQMMAIASDISLFSLTRHEFDSI
jgi:hypothetical protein